MTVKIENGNYCTDNNGRLLQMDGIYEIIERAKIRLAVKKGSFRLDPELGSELHTVDLNRCDNELLYALVCDALIFIPEISVTAVKRVAGAKKDALYIEICLSVLLQEIELKIEI